MGKKIAFLSALGGQGCTLSAACIAKALAESGRPAALIDLCGFGGTAAHVLGVEENVVMNLCDVASGECEPEEALLDCGEHFKLLPSGSFSEKQVAPCSVEARRLVESLARGADVAVDWPTGTVPDCGAVSCFDTFVICSCADTLSLRYAEALCRLIKRAREETAHLCDIRLLLTRFSPEGMRDGGVKDIDQCIDTVGARLLGVFPFDRTAGLKALRGEPPDDGCELMRYAREAASRLCGEKVALDARGTFSLLR